MVDPISVVMVCSAAVAPTLAAMVGDVAGNITMGVLGNEAHARLRSQLPKLYSRFTRDRIPVNHHVEGAARTALRQSLLTFSQGLAATTDPTPGNFARVLAYLKRGPRFEAEELARRREDEAAWLKRFRDLVDDDVSLGELDVITPETAHKLLASSGHDSGRITLHAAVHDWAERHLSSTDGWPSDWQRCLNEGWALDPQGTVHVTLYQAWCLHFREAIKGHEEAFRIFVAQQLADLVPQDALERLDGKALVTWFDDRLRPIDEVFARIESTLGRIEPVVVDTHALARDTNEWVRRLAEQIESRGRAAGDSISFDPRLPPQASFVGRAHELERLRQVLVVGASKASLGANATRQARARNWAIVHGMPGVGKSRLAVEFSTRYASHFDQVHVCNAESAESLVASLSRVAKQLKIADQRRSDELAATDVLQAIAASRERWLLVYDNVEEESTVPLWPPGSACVLITSRFPNWTLEGAVRLELRELPESEAAELLQTLALSDPDGAYRLVQEIGGPPVPI